jgi:AcrR family transcriptional regulator
VPTPAPVAQHEELLDRLVDLFLAEGFRRFTMSDLAGRLRCSKTTLYSLGHSKEQVTSNVVRRFFQRAATAVEERTLSETDAARRIVVYLDAVAEALRTASQAFMADLALHPPSREVYERNTELASNRVRTLIAEGVERGEFRPVHAAFVGDVVATTMARIQSGEISRQAAIDDADAYSALADLVLHGVRGDHADHQ